MTPCTPISLAFHDLGTRPVLASFDGGTITSDAGGLLLREVEARFRFVEQFARYFTDHRDPDRIEHTLHAPGRPADPGHRPHPLDRPRHRRGS